MLYCPILASSSSHLVRSIRKQALNLEEAEVYRQTVEVEAVHLSWVEEKAAAEVHRSRFPYCAPLSIVVTRIVT